jgi:predicted RNA binding protein YcfA (HicA-like mRNA interferase family)
MNSQDIISKLTREGWARVGGKGDHMKFKHPEKTGHVVVPHPRKDIRLGTLRSIYRQAGWAWKE